MAERRTVVVAARVTRAEHAAWKEKAAAAGVSPSALLRMAMARTQTWTAPALAVERERSRQIARCGNNLNQIARWANTHASALNAVRVLDGLRAVERALRALARPAGDTDAH
ncbi:MAG: MobC family plasmid mobilization relaxosome protein [Acidobacteriota bacterium]|nr:MobC family plasmid mobilization relaxosome protein [Acidobacteriota bacterium]MDE3261042.1 MobC family plasmid mobilization relaxosome protein [Acidobacteriota bacterium]